MMSSMYLETRFCARNYRRSPVIRLRGDGRDVDLPTGPAMRQIRVVLERPDEMRLAL